MTARFRAREWLDHHVAHKWTFVPRWLRRLVCNSYDRWVLRTCIPDEPGEPVKQSWRK